MGKELLEALVELVAPGVISKNFDIKNIIENSTTITIYFEEKAELVPKILEGKETVLNGYLNPIELQTFPLKDKQVYLSLRRRRWKEQGENKGSYSNEYSINREGMKTTKEFGDFLKEEFRLSPAEYNKFWESPALTRGNNI